MYTMKSTESATTASKTLARELTYENRGRIDNV